MWSVNCKDVEIKAHNSGDIEAQKVTIDGHNSGDINATKAIIKRHNSGDVTAVEVNIFGYNSGKVKGEKAVILKGYNSDEVVAPVIFYQDLEINQNKLSSMKQGEQIQQNGMTLTRIDADLWKIEESGRVNELRVKNEKVYMKCVEGGGGVTINGITISGAKSIIINGSSITITN